VFGSLGSLVAAFKLPDLRKRILFVFLMFGVFVIGVHIPSPGITRKGMAALERMVGEYGFLGLFDVFSGGAFRRFSILAMSITPYINASIIFQLLGIALPRIHQMMKEGGPEGQKKISQWTRYLTMVLAAFQATGLCFWLRSAGVITFAPFQLFSIVLALTAGTAFLMWMGNQITDKGIGNGVSLVIFCGIVMRMPYEVGLTFQSLRAGTIHWWNAAALLAVWIATVAGVIVIQQGQRKIPLQHAKRVVGTRIYGGASSSFPIRVNQAGVIPIIFAIAIALFPGQIASMMGHAPEGTLAQRAGELLVLLTNWLNPASSEIWPKVIGSLWYFLLVVFFTYFYTAVTFNVPDVSDNLKKYGSFIPGIRPGKPTEQFLDRVLSRITLAGAIFLGVIALLSYYIPGLTGVHSFTVVGGTSLLILVAVALETMQQIEAHLVMRQYEGFIR
jgi:preprotein translocase subunit SecY